MPAQKGPLSNSASFVHAGFPSDRVQDESHPSGFVATAVELRGTGSKKLEVTMRGSIQRRGKGTWRLVFDLERSATGKRRQRVVQFQGTKREAEEELSRIIAEITNGGFSDPGNITVAEYLNRWLEHVATKTAAKTFERYAEIVRLNLIPHLGGLKLSKLRPIHIQQFYAASLAKGRVRKAGGLSPRTVLHYHRIISQALKQAVKWQLLARNPAEAVEPPKPSHHEMVVLDGEQIAELLDSVTDTPFHIPVLLAVTTGMRRGEILALRWSDVDLERGTLAVTQTLEKSRRAGLQFKPPKTKRSRRNITLPPITVDMLRSHRTAQAQLFLRLGRGWNRADLVCTKVDGGPINPNTLTSGFASLVRRTDIPAITFHGLRHTHATHLFQAGVHPKVAQERLGHSTVAVTLDLYSHVMPGMQEDAAMRVDRALKTALGKRHNSEI
jgi:integrase